MRQPRTTYPSIIYTYKRVYIYKQDTEQIFEADIKSAPSYERERKREREREREKKHERKRNRGRKGEKEGERERERERGRER